MPGIRNKVTIRDPIAEKQAARDAAIEFQMPILPDPGKGENETVEKLDFSVRLGSTLARGIESDKRTVEKSWQQKSTKRRESSTSLIVPGSRKVSSVTPRSPVDPEAPGRNGGGPFVTRSRKESRRMSTRLSTISNQFVEEDDKETALMKVQRIFKAVRIISGVCQALKRYVKACETKSWSFMEMYLHVKRDLNLCLAFNPQSFARVEPERHKLRKLLEIEGPDRTAEDAKVILALLRDNTSFQDYPYHVQFQLSLCMTYQSYETRRVILKQGHRPEAFYILLSGYVMANIQDKSPETGKQFVKTVKEMGPGDTFGEVALIEGGRRTATIVCKTNVELLVIMKEDFDNIIRGPLVKQIDEHVNFCKTMALFQDFPCDKLAENPSQFFYHFFKKGDLVVKDSTVSKYIIVVKAGKCQVVCNYTETVLTPKPRHVAPSILSRRSNTTLSVGSQSDMDAAFPHYNDMEKIRALHRKPKSEAERQKDDICLGLLTGQIDRNRLADHGPDARPKSSMTTAEVEKVSKPPLKKSKTLSNFYDNLTRMRRENISTDEDLVMDMQTKFWNNRLRHYVKKSSTAAARHGPLASARLSSSRKRTANPFYSTEKHVYAQIAILGPGTVFGLESLVQKPSVNMSLVSDGAECIFISKRIFLALANIKVLRVVTDMIQTYPSQEFIQDQVKSYRNWQKYKRGLVQGVLNRPR